METFLKDNFKIIFPSIIFLISLLSGIYIYTQNTGYIGCLNTWAKARGSDNFVDHQKSRGVSFTTEQLLAKNFCSQSNNTN
tara:strand:- start:302 stop:544 length:243 start_codon:yes stop_codon:yes gene_type:complete